MKSWRGLRQEGFGEKEEDLLNEKDKLLVDEGNEEWIVNQIEDSVVVKGYVRKE